MNRINTLTQFIREQLHSIIGKTKAKTYFSYYGIFKDDAMFGLYKEKKFYLRLALEDIKEALSYPGVEVLNDPDLTCAKFFYYLPDAIVENLSHYEHWIKNSIKEIQEQKQTSYYQQRDKIRFLPNMSIRLERLLRKINVFTITEFMQKGEISIFVDLVKLGVSVSQITLFHLYGARVHQFTYTIPLSKRIELLNEANNALYAAGLRKQFDIDKEILSMNGYFFRD